MIMVKLKMPNFFIVGAPKCGTTSLYHYLDQSNDIFFSKIKEPEFFCFDGDFDKFYNIERITKKHVLDLESYKALFDEAQSELIRGEASPTYLYSSCAPRKIYDLIPDAKIVVMLRNPINRAFSHYMHNIHMGLEELCTFEEAIRAENERIKQNWAFYWHYLRMGMYSEQLVRYFDYFSIEQIKVIIFDDFVSDPVAVVRDVCNFLCVNENFNLDVSKKYAVSGKPYLKILTKLIVKPNKIKNILKKIIPVEHGRAIKHFHAKYFLKKENIKASTRKWLERYYKNDIHKLEKLISRDLSKWLVN